MTYVPHGPLWCWALQGADALFFSQPTETFLYTDTPTRYTFPGRGPCVARCQHETRFVNTEVVWDMDQDPQPPCLPPVQCGRVARLDPTSRFLCDLHYRQEWICSWCDAPLPAPAQQLTGADGWSYCSPPCAAEAGEEV